MQLPELSAEVAAACDLVKGRFTGDPSTELVVEIAADGTTFCNNNMNCR